MVIASALAAACSEHTVGGAACPILCPEQNVTVLDTVFEAVALDSSVSGFPPFGTEPSLLLATRGDTLDTRAVVRFDSLKAFYTTPAGDSAVEQVDSAYVQLHIDKVHSTYTAPVTIQVFNVDTVEADTSVVAEAQNFTPHRLIGTVTLDTNQILDSIRVPLDTAAVRAAVLDRSRLRLGLRATSAAPVMLQVVSAEGGQGPVLRYFAVPDSAIAPVETQSNVTGLISKIIAPDFRDYLVVIKAPPTPGNPILTVGGVPGRRVYLRFNIPSHIVDSSTVLRAALILTENPNHEIDEEKVLTIYPQLVVAGNDVLDIGRSTLLLAPAGLGFDSVQVTPKDSGEVQIEIVNAVRTWSQTIAKNAQRAIVLRTPDEALLPHRVFFFSSEAPAAVRPRLRVNYSPRAKFGIP